MNNENTNNESIIIEDLAAANTDEIKGGPSTQSKRTVLLKSTVAGEEGDGETTSFNHNETVSEDNDFQEAATEPLADLAVDQDSEAEIKGGMQYRAKRAELPPN